MTLRLTTAMRSVTGPHRASNQDSLGCSDDYVFVADGVGGNVGGDVASWTVTHRLMSALATRHARDLDTDELRVAIAQANAELGLRVQREPALSGMATTFTGLFCSEGAVRIAHIGDSRAFLVRDGVGRRMTRDDSLVQLLVDAGVIEPEQADHHPNRNVILRSLAGSLADTDGMTLLSVPAQVGDRWLVASDGLTDYVDEPQVLEMLASAPSPEDACEALVAAALEADSRDNISVAVSDVVDSADPQARPYRYLGAAASDDQGSVGDLSR
ncbi:MAG TPA: protein phosphatase 2C domain-containing protein [Actinotalea sp.]